MPECFSATVDAEGRLAADASAAVVPWWSFSKTLIAACALRLAEQGRLSLDGILDEGPYSLRDLLQHRAGLGNYGGMAAYHQAVARNEEPWTDTELLARIPPDRLAFPPRQGFAYSNVGFLLVRRRIERAGGAGLGILLQHLVLAPLGLVVARLAETRADMRGTVFAGGQDYHPGWAFHGVVIGPVAEAALALHRLLRGRLLNAASRAALIDRQPIGGRMAGRPWVATGYGLGLMIGEALAPGLSRPMPVAGHSAAGPGSVGAVYHRLGAEPARTAAVFMAAAEEGPAEHRAMHLLAMARCHGGSAGSG
ncbi:beta-lactamase family protein [Siccirubricoccus sp. KC 17139]|uniref:Beta-lactamase family protein n=1 Tax=Siccirubricoccus soli TaxID=2899147 RepID=A0ABT1D849_9PROT|nr:serine hydrolase domain-containing protein [Siccirubricoccus soli]MCO6418115.1 beta-lactamase family protein [Siccirubricoccus soli]MCP2684250.1 beta-lactamase family protein [Siccirubricoccus soli]